MDKEEIEVEQKFITSPADVEVHRKVELQDADVSDDHKQQFKELCAEYSDVFSKNSGDLGRTPLVIIDIDAGDNPPISQRPYKPGEPPRRRLCVDYRAINKLLPTVQKEGSKVKGVLTLVPLPKIDEIYRFNCVLHI